MDLRARNAWYAKLPWLVGCNYIPSSAINELEFWQKETYDPQTIDRELGWEEGLGMNIARVFLHNLVWEKDHDAFLDRMDNFLTIADKHHIKILFVLFDDCWNSDPKLGKQPDPIPGVHNSGWMQAPGFRRVNDPATWGPLEQYEKAVLKRFGNDPRVLFWDLYTSPATVDRRSRTGTTPSRSSSPCSNGLAKPSPPSRSPSMSGGPIPISIATLGTTRM